MSQISFEEMQRRNILLKKSKQILLQEYAAERTQQHQQWIRDSETSWRTNGVLMAYPQGKLYPSEQDIIDKALELYNQSIAPTAPNVVIPAIKDTLQESSIPEPLGSSPMDVTAKLQEVYNRAPNVPIDSRLFTIPISDYVESLTPTVPEQPNIIPEPITEPVVEEPIVEPVVEEPNTIETTPKHSLLRSVLSGWLSKNKDKET
jgi:hypothetical protein